MDQCEREEKKKNLLHNLPFLVRHLMGGKAPTESSDEFHLLMCGRTGEGGCMSSRMRNEVDGRL